MTRQWIESRIAPQPSPMLPLHDQQNTSGGIDHPLTRIDKQRWIKSFERLRDGYSSRHHGQSLPPAVITAIGWQLAQKKGGHERDTFQSDLLLFLPVIPGRTSPRKLIRDGFQWAHRVVCYLTKSEVDVYNLLCRGYEASHLCHQPACINPDHLAVETMAANKSRKICSGKVNVKMSVNGRDYLLKTEEYPHSPPCVIRLESRAAIELRADGSVGDTCS
ncbi:hypothetical protein POJ06DRAFT_253352, partial [Lipomyces tetrasporus]